MWVKFEASVVFLQIFVDENSPNLILRLWARSRLEKEWILAIFWKSRKTTKFYANEIFFFFSIWVFFHNHSWIKGLQRKGEGISLTPHYYFHTLYRHLNISWTITEESSSLHIGSSKTRTGNLWFPSASR